MLWLMTQALAEDLLNRDPVGWGVGIVLGLPTGLTGAYHPEEKPYFFDAAIAWGLDPDPTNDLSSVQSTFLIQGDALIVLKELTTPGWDDLKFPVYIGAGPRLSFSGKQGLNSGNYLGVRVPVGMGFYHLGLPIEGFLELGPGVRIIPDTTFFCDVAVGARFYFGPGTYRQPEAVEG